MPTPAQFSSHVHRLDRLAIGRVVLLVLLVVGASLGVLFGLAQLPLLAQPGKLVYHEDGFRQLTLALTPARLVGLRLALGAATLIGLAGWLTIRKRESTLLEVQLLRAAGRLRSYWQRVPAEARSTGLLALAAVQLARLYYLLAYPLSTDEIASYDYFVRQGPHVILSYYPIPNNHLLYNLLAWPLSLTPLPPLLVMRLPTWLLGSIGQVFTLGLLSRVLGLRRAIAVTLLVGLTPIQVYYGAVGRGYGLQLSLVQAGFFAVLELLQPKSSYRQLAWATFLLSSIGGLLLVPSYAYPLAALLLGLAGGMSWQKNWSALFSLALAGAGIGLITMLLYSPLGAISGWHQLVANRYVASRAAAQFWPGFRPRLYEVASELLALPVRFSGPLWLGIALLGGAICWRLRPGSRRRAALLAWVLMALPIGLLAAQRVFPLARVLLYVPWAGAVWLLLLPRRKWSGYFRPLGIRLAVCGLAGLGAVQLSLNEPRLRGTQRETRLVQQAYHWLQRAAPGHPNATAVVGLQAPIHELFMAHYLVMESRPALRLVSYRTRQPAPDCDFIVLSHAAAAAGCQGPRPPYVVGYSDALVTIYTRLALQPEAAQAH